MSDILDLIDQAIDDCAVSGDAMRWTPDAVPAEGPYADLAQWDWEWDPQSLFGADHRRRIAALLDVPVEILLDDGVHVIARGRLDMPVGMQFALYGNAYVRAPRRGRGLTHDLRR